MRGKTLKSLVALGLAGWAGPVLASDKLAFGPPPGWVVPTAPLPDDPKAPAKDSDAGMRVVLQDQQEKLDPGSQARYFENIVKIQTPQGLANGAVNIAWDPDIDSVEIHKLHIVRGGQVIDVLAGGQTFTVLRRETNLENATLDGVLTGTIQPEGLQVGDTIDFAATVTRHDPAVGQHVETVAGGWNGVPIDRAHLRISWPSDIAMRLRAMPGIAVPTPHKTKDGTTAIETTLDHLQPFQTPKGAPLRYQLVRAIEATDFTSWSQLSALMAPLYDKAARITPGSPLDGEVKAIRARTTDPKAQAEAALALVQDRVRYVFLGMNDGGLIPADAEITWSRRFGDCKGKTVLLLAILHALGIAAQPALANATLGDGLDQRLPMVADFDHIFVGATIGGKLYWIDGTRTGDLHLDRIDPPAFDWVLPVAPGARLVAVMPGPLDTPATTTTIRIDASAGISLPAPFHVETMVHGDGAVGLHAQLANLSGAALDNALSAYWRKRYDFVTVKSTKTTYDPDQRTQTLTMDGDAAMDWSTGSYETDGVGVGYKADFSRDPGTDATAPFAVSFPDYSRTVETIVFPKVWRTKPDPVTEIDQTVAGVAYHRHATLADNVYTIEETERSLQPEFPAADAPAAQKTLRALAEKAVWVRQVGEYRETDKELDAQLTKTPTTAAEFLDRGNTLLDRARYDEAIADFDKAIALDPKNAPAFADRGIAHAWKNEGALATGDLDAAAAIDPRQIVVFRARGLLALRDGRAKDAVVALSTALDIQPGDLFALGLRVSAYRLLGDDDRLMSDAAAYLRQDPGNIAMYLARANALRRKGQMGQMLAEVSAMLTANPSSSYAHVTAGRLYSASGKQDQAMAEFDRALAIKPENYIYLNRAEIRPPADYAGRQADIDLALELAPNDPDTLSAEGSLQQDRKDYAGAIATWTKLLATDPSDLTSRTRRAIAYLKAGQQADAQKDFAAVRGAKPPAVILNNLCWAEATADVALDAALADCDAALAQQPDTPGYLDSRGLVLLRLGRLDQAIDSYDRALAKDSRLAGSLFGRAAAKAGKADKAGAEADLKAARLINPDVETEFAGYGVTVAGS